MSTVEGLLLGGDFLGAISLIYTSVMGPLFFGALVSLAVIPIYFKTNSIVLPVAIVLLLAGLFETVIPGPALDFLRFMVVIAIAAGLFLIMTRGR